ncbi:MAG: zinc ribbon domain-containing protein [Chloroflexaceae bacterium]|nr:zinc ribbon domain-containing protein [Chloroflexaceae bacterium]NJO06783.1 zinc ribbon domain-containing protein [Chloroflexaceae bacterium]
MEIIQDFLTNLRPILNLIGVVLGAYLILLWAASVLWAYRDIRSRSDDVSVQVLAVGLVLAIPFAGIPLHLMLRPRQTLSERYERSLEEEYLRRDIEEKNACPACHRPIESDFLLCPYCHTTLRRNCAACDRVVDLTWSICPYCGYDGNTIALTSTAAPYGQPEPHRHPHRHETQQFVRTE